MANDSLKLSNNSYFLPTPNGSVKNASTNDRVTASLAFCVVNSLLAPMTVTANAFILIAVWKNLSLRTPSYVLLAGLAFTDFFTGLLTQPLFVLTKMAETSGNEIMFRVAARGGSFLGHYFSAFNIDFFNIDSSRKMDVYEPKVSPNSATSRCSLHHLSWFTNSFSS